MDIRELYGAGSRLFIRKTFSFWQALGFHISPNNFYEPIPDTRELPDALWQKREPIPGIELDITEHLKLLKTLTSKYRVEFELFPKHKTDIPHQYYLQNGEYESVDAEILHSMVRHFKPRTMIEVGSGFSTQISANAMVLNAKEDNKQKGKLIAIEPYPKKRLPNKIPGLSKIISKKVQDVPVGFFSKLKKDDIFFIDSSHVLKIGSDVQYEYLEILPRLNKGVIIHIHDVFFPREYPKKWIFEFRKFWNEQYLVQAFLMYNPNFEIIWSGANMSLHYPDKLAKAFSSFSVDKTPGSLWLRKIK